MHDIRTVKCPKCGAEVQIFDSDRLASCPKCGASFQVPSILEEKLAEQAKEAMDQSVQEIRQKHEPDQKNGKDSGKLRQMIRIVIFVLILLIAFCILMMMSSTHIVN